MTDAQNKLPEHLREMLITYGLDTVNALAHTAIDKGLADVKSPIIQLGVKALVEWGLAELRKAVEAELPGVVHADEVIFIGFEKK